MNLNQSLYAELNAHAGLTDLIGSKVAKGVIDEEWTLPAIAFDRISRTPVHASGSDISLNETRYQISVFADGAASVDLVTAQVLDCLRDFTGQLGTTGINVQRIFFDEQIEMIEKDTITHGITYHNALDFLIWAEE